MSLRRNTYGTTSRYRPYSNPGGVTGLATRLAGQVAKQVLKSSFKRTPVTEKPENADTRHNLNTTFDTTSLYTKKYKKGRKLSKKAVKYRKTKKVFKKKVKKALSSFQPWNVFKLNYTNTYADNQVPSSLVERQNVSPLPTAAFPTAIGIGWGGALTNTKDVANIFQQLEGLGHVEDGTARVDDAFNPLSRSIQFTGTIRINISFNNAGISALDSWYVDVYEVTAARNMTAAENSYNTPTKAWDNLMGFNSLPFDAAATVRNSYIYKGSIPSDVPDFKKYWTIDQVTRIKVTYVAQEFQFTMKTGGKLTQRNSDKYLVMKGITKALFCVVAPVGNPALGATLNMDYLSEKTFKFKNISDGNAGAVIPAVPNVQWNYQRLTTV